MLFLSDLLYRASCISELKCPGFWCQSEQRRESNLAHSAVIWQRGFTTCGALGIAARSPAVGDDAIASPNFSPKAAATEKGRD